MRDDRDDVRADGVDGVDDRADATDHGYPAHVRHLDARGRRHARGDCVQPVLRLLPELLDDGDGGVRAAHHEHPLEALARGPEPVGPGAQGVPAEQRQHEKQRDGEQHVGA